MFLNASSDLKTLIALTNNELEKAAEWFQSNKLSLNVSKTKYIIFRSNKMHLSDTMDKLTLGNQEIERIGEDCKTKSFKFVGIFLDEYLTVTK